MGSGALAGLGVGITVRLGVFACSPGAEVVGDGETGTADDVEMTGASGDSDSVGFSRPPTSRAPLRVVMTCSRRYVSIDLQSPLSMKQVRIRSSRKAEPHRNTSQAYPLTPEQRDGYAGHVL